MTNPRNKILHVSITGAPECLNVYISEHGYNLLLQLAIHAPTPANAAASYAVQYEQ